MIKAVMAIAAVAAASLIAVANGSAASPPSDVTCSQVTNSFSGTAYNLIVPANGGCHIESATITNDLIAEHDSGVSLTTRLSGPMLSSPTAPVAPSPTRPSAAMPSTLAMTAEATTSPARRSGTT